LFHAIGDLLSAIVGMTSAIRLPGDVTALPRDIA
jgi:hypothetical protein